MCLCACVSQVNIPIKILIILSPPEPIAPAASSPDRLTTERRDGRANRVHLVPISPSRTRGCSASEVEKVKKKSVSQVRQSEENKLTCYSAVGVLLFFALGRA